MKENHKKYISTIAFLYCCSYPPKRFFALLEDIEHRRDTKDFCLFTKENKETEKKSLDLLLHERRSFFLCDVVLCRVYDWWPVSKLGWSHKSIKCCIYLKHLRGIKNKLGRENQKFHPFVLSFWHS